MDVLSGQKRCERGEEKRRKCWTTILHAISLHVDQYAIGNSCLNSTGKIPASIPGRQDAQGEKETRTPRISFIRGVR